MSKKTVREKSQKRPNPTKKRASDLFAVVRQERKRLNKNLKVIVSALSDLDDYDRGLASYEQEDPLDGQIAFLLRTFKLLTDPVLICCATPDGAKKAVITALDIGFSGDGRFSVSIKATHACGIFAYRLTTTIYEYLPSQNMYSILTVPPGLTESGLSGPLDRTWSRGLAPLSPDGAFYRVEVSGKVFPPCPGVQATAFARSVVGPI